MTDVYDLRDITRSFTGRPVLDHLSLRIGEGETVALTGESGSGKSTLLNILGLLDEQDSGELIMFGRPAPRPRSRAARAYLRTRLGYLFQNFALIDGATVSQNLELALTYVRSAVPHRTAIAHALAEVGLAGSEDRRISSLSGGEAQRVAIARLLLKPCTVVLADEPTGALDARNRDTVLGLLHRLNDAGTTLVIATHDPVVSGACTRTIAL